MGLSARHQSPLVSPRALGSLIAVLLCAHAGVTTGADLPVLVQQALSNTTRPPPELMLADNAAAEVVRQMGADFKDARTAHVRVLRWLGDPQGIQPVETLLSRRAVDRYEGVRTLVALDAPSAGQRALDLFADDPSVGAPLVASYHDGRGCQLARRLLGGEDSRNWLPAVWVLSNSRDREQMNILQEYTRRFAQQDKESLKALSFAVRRLYVEQRDIRTEVLWEYLEDYKDGPLDQQLWCIYELGALGERSGVIGLKKYPWAERSKQDDVLAATILWARAVGGDKLTPEELRHLRIERFRLDWIRRGTRWPPAADNDEQP